MDAGRVEILDGEVVGEALLVAAELAWSAPIRGSTLTTAALHDLLGVPSRVRAIGPYRLRSLGRTVELFDCNRSPIRLRSRT